MSDELIRNDCKQCGGRIKFPPSAAGTKVACPHCDWPVVLTIPETQPVPAPPAAPDPKSLPDVMPGAPVASAGHVHATPKWQLIGIPALCFLLVFGVILVAAIKKSRKGTQVVENVEEEEGETSRTPKNFKPLKRAKPKKSFNYQKPPPPIKTTGEITFNNPTPRKAGEDLQLMGHKVQKAAVGNLQYVYAEVFNHSKNLEYFNVNIEFDLFNKQGRKIGVAKDYLGDLPPLGKWSVKAVIFEKDVASAKLSRLTGEGEKAMSVK